MKLVKTIFVLFVTITAVIVSAYLVVEYMKTRPGGIRVVTTPASNIYIDGERVGKSPYKGIFSKDQITIKIVPDTANTLATPYETKVNLVPGIQTEVRYEFGNTQEDSAGDVISFERISGNLAGLVIVSTPQNAEVWIDGTYQGKTPYNFGSITLGSHEVILKNTGFKDRTLNLKTKRALRLTAFIKLAKLPPPQASPTPLPQALTPQGVVTIGKTDTGFLRLRTEPGSAGEEIAELSSGEKYPYLETDQKSGWYKILYKEPTSGLPNGVTGWVSNQYSTLSERTILSATPIQ